MELRNFLVRLAGFVLLVLLLGDLLYMHSLPQGGGMLPVISILNCGDRAEEGAKEPPASESVLGGKNLSETLPGGSKPSVELVDAPVPIMFLATDLSPFVIVCLKTARKYNPEVPIYMVTSEHSVKPDGPMIDLLSIPNVHVKVIEQYLGEGTDSALFHERYIHQSVTAVPFERFCFQRFMVLRDIAREEGVARFLHMDYDIALFTDTRTFSKFDADLVALNTHSTFFSLWKMPLLQRFCDYMLEFYHRPQDAIAQDWDRYGQHFNETFIQFSDMFMLYSFLDKNQDSVTTKFLVYDKDGFTPDYLQYWAMVNLQNFIGWDCLQEDFNSHVEWDRNERGLLIPVANSTVLQGIHWQGYMCKQIAPLIMGPILADEGKPKGGVRSSLRSLF